MKKTKSYRVGAAFMAALMVLTCMPQSGMYVLAQEDASAEQETMISVSETEPELENPSEPSAESPVVSAAEEQETATAEVKPNADGDTPTKPDPIHVASITLNHDELKIQKEDSAELKYTLAPTNANVEEEKEVDFESANTSIATVAKKADGATIVGVSVGKTTITATTKNGKQASCVVEITPIPVKEMSVTPEKLEMTKGDTAKLSVLLKPANADNQTILLGSYYNKEIIEATCDNTTKEITVVAKKGGYTTLTVKSQDNDKVYKNIVVQVSDGANPLTGLSAEVGYPTKLYQGDAKNLKKFVKFTPFDATDKELVWSVEGDGAAPAENPNRKYVDVTQNGEVTAKWDETDDAPEKIVSIIASSKTNSSITPAKFTITIKRNVVPLKALHLKSDKLVMEDAGSKNIQTIGVQLEPLRSTDRKITAVVSDRDGKRAVSINAGGKYDAGEAAATATGTADEDGWVYFTVKANALEEPKRQDTCTITFIKEGDNPNNAVIKVRCNVTVNKYVTPVEKLTLPDSLVMTDLTTENLSAVIEPLEAEDRNIIWTVDDPEIVSIGGVDADGRIEATKDPTSGELTATVQIIANMVGKCSVTATAAGDVKKTCEVTVGQTANPAAGLTIRSDGVTTGETTEITLRPGQTYTLKPEITPSDADNKKVKWTSSSSSVASVERGTDGAGIVTANETGVCEITAQASGESAACTKKIKVNVKAPLLEVSYKGHPAKWSYTPADQPITEETLRNELVVSFYPRLKPIPEEDKLSLGSGEANNYDLRILREDGKTEKIYTPDDMMKPGMKTLVISYTYDGQTYKGTVPVEMQEFDAADLISVTPLSGEDAEIWNVANATPATALPLPETTEILVGRDVIVEGKPQQKTSKLDAEIDWHVADSGYDPANTEAQEFTVIGEVVLPEYVSNRNNVSRRVQVQVYVRELAFSGKKMARPVFSVSGGEVIGNKTAVTLPYGTRIEIGTIGSTDNAEIYYMVDRRPDEQKGVPHDAEHQYKSPIVITAKTTTIYAVAVKHGYEDSDCSECTIKLEREDPVDPDDPNAAPLPDDVTDEDREQIGGRVPDGLWAVVQKGEEEKDGFAYTGKAIKPAVHVYDRTMLLTEKKDYTVAYSNNTNAGSAVGSAKPPTITVTGKGNYEGKAVVHFTIKPQNIADDSVLTDSYLAVAYNAKKAQKPNPTLTWNGKKLVKNKDYTYTDASYTAPGTYKITVDGIGNYTGSKVIDFEIYEVGVAVSKLTFSKIPNYKYTGTEIGPDVTVKYKNTLLFEGTEKGSTGNYWIKYENCTNVGNASVVIVGKGAYKGSKRINFKIQPVAKISQAGIALDVQPAGVAYTGKAHTPKCTVNYLGKQLEENKDYKLSYQNNVNAGKATVVITGMGAFNGTAKKTFKILQNNISGLAAVMDSSYVYEKGGCKPKPEVTCNGMKLKEGTDYTLSYKNHNKIGNTAYVTIKGKGNYKGQIVRYFEVTMQDISKLKVVANDKAYQRKKNIYKTKVQVIDKNGKALAAGTDYSKDIYYTYETGDRAGQPVLATDIIPAGTVIGVDIRVANPRCYHGSIHGTYRIVQSDISGAKVSIEPQEYTGRSVRLKKSQIQVTLKGVLLGDNDYEIVGYENNVNQGTAKVTLKGREGSSYGGTKTATFKIKKKGILNLKF